MAIIIHVYTIVFGTWGLIRSTGLGRPVSFLSVSKTISETLLVYVCPPVGIHMSNDPCGQHPFQGSSLATPYTLWALFALAYFCSRYFKQHLPPLLSLLMCALLIMGFIFCVTLSIHFIPVAPVVLFPVIGLLALSPLFCSIYLFKEIVRYNAYYRFYFKNASGLAASKFAEFYSWLSHNHLFFAVYLLAPLLLLVQGVLYLAGQQPDSLITQFTESCGFLLSKHQSCSCGGDHYLCSIAANGHKKLVKPLRFGIRQNEKIVVNRQLLVANAFEHWLEEYAPRFHRLVRKTYDSMNIPVNAWSKHKPAANVIYVLMKPLEWFFLLWLYLFDRQPENRIAVQYFPKHDLNTYLRQHENK